MRVGAIRVEDLQPRPRPPARRSARSQAAETREAGRFARWHVEPPADTDSDSWMLSYLDVFTVLLAMLVVMLAVSRMAPAAPKAADAHAAPGQVSLVGSLKYKEASASAAPDSSQPESVAPAGWADMPASPDEDEAAAHAAVATLAPIASTPAADVAASETAVPPSGDAQAAAIAAADATATKTAMATPERVTATAKPAEAAKPPSLQALGLDKLGKSVDVIVNEKTISFRISNELLFPSGQATLRPAGLDVLQRLAQVLKKNGYQVSVEGHSDSVSIRNKQFPSNWELSAGRAASVLRELAREGVQAGRLRAVGYADTRPIGSNSTPEGRAANRRVELIMEIVPAPASTQNETDPQKRS